MKIMIINKEKESEKNQKMIEGLNEKSKQENDVFIKLNGNLRSALAENEKARIFKIQKISKFRENFSKVPK